MEARGRGGALMERGGCGCEVRTGAEGGGSARGVYLGEWPGGKATSRHLDVLVHAQAVHRSALQPFHGCSIALGHHCRALAVV